MLLRTLLATIADLDQAIITRLGKHPKVHLLARLPQRRPAQPRPTAGRTRPHPGPHQQR
jgi:hypothetical protein